MQMGLSKLFKWPMDEIDAFNVLPGSSSGAGIANSLNVSIRNAVPPCYPGCLVVKLNSQKSGCV